MKRIALLALLVGCGDKHYSVQAPKEEYSNYQYPKGQYTQIAYAPQGQAVNWNANTYFYYNYNYYGYYYYPNYVRYTRVVQRPYFQWWVTYGNY